MLRCIRCGACLNHCPVYSAIGGHAYGWVYPGPMGSVLSPGLIGIEKTKHLPQASTLCGKCEEVCPVRIPLPNLLRNWRFQVQDQNLMDWKTKWGIKVWAYFAKRFRFYRIATRWSLYLLALSYRKYGKFKNLPFPESWTRYRDIPAPQGKTFIDQWQEQNK